jgi:hypothetical protein
MGLTSSPKGSQALGQTRRISNLSRRQALFPLLTEDMMEKAFEANKDGAQHQVPGVERDPQKLHGKAFQVNENSVEEEEAIRPSAAPDVTNDQNNDQKLHGRSSK